MSTTVPYHDYFHSLLVPSMSLQKLESVIYIPQTSEFTLSWGRECVYLTMWIIEHCRHSLI